MPGYSATSDRQPVCDVGCSSGSRDAADVLRDCTLWSSRKESTTSRLQQAREDATTLEGRFAWAMLRVHPQAYKGTLWRMSDMPHLFLARFHNQVQQTRSMWVELQQVSHGPDGVYARSRTPPHLVTECIHVAIEQQCLATALFICSAWPSRPGHVSSALLSIKHSCLLCLAT